MSLGSDLLLYGSGMAASLLLRETLRYPAVDIGWIAVIAFGLGAFLRAAGQ